MQPEEPLMHLRSLTVAASVSLILGACAPPGTPYATRYVRSLLEERHDNVIVQKWDLSCGAAALATLLTYHLDRPVTEHQIAAALLKRYHNIGQVQRQLGFSLLDLKSFAVSQGFTATGYGGVGLHDLVDIGPSIIPVHINGFNHFVVFRGIHGSRVLLADPAFGNRTMQLDYFMAIWQSRMAFVVSVPEGQQVADRLAPRPSDFWATSVGNEHDSRQTLALEAEAEGVATGTELAKAAPAAAPTSVIAASVTIAPLASRPEVAAPAATAAATATASVTVPPLADVIAGGEPEGAAARTASAPPAAPPAPPAPSPVAAASVVVPLLASSLADDVTLDRDRRDRAAAPTPPE